MKEHTQVWFILTLGWSLLFGASIYDVCKIFGIFSPPPPLSLTEIQGWWSDFQNVTALPSQKYIFTDRQYWGQGKKVTPFFPQSCWNHLLLFLSSAFWGPPSYDPLRTSYMESPLLSGVHSYFGMIFMFPYDKGYCSIRWGAQLILWMPQLERGRERRAASGLSLCCPMGGVR